MSLGVGLGVLSLLTVTTSSYGLSDVVMRFCLVGVVD
jgi:hypothetical protein